MLRTRRLLMLIPAAAASAAIAQTPAPTPLEKAVESRADAPATIEDKPKLNDPEIERLMSALTGSFAAVATADSPALRLNSCAAKIDGLDNAVYFEIARDDSPATPFRQGVFHAYRHGAGGGREVRLRVFEFTSSGIRDTLVGLWAAPDALPALSVETLVPNLDLVMSASGSGSWQGSVPHAYPTARGGAVEMTATMSIAPGQIAMRDGGFSADGMQVWGSREVEGPVFKKSADSPASVRRVDGGLIVITLVPPAPDAVKLVENGQVAVQYTGWLAADGTRFDTSRQAGREAFMLRVPGPVIRGWNEGLREIARGERRRLIIPSGMAYGEQGTRDRRIPPNATLVFDVECVYLDNTLPTPPPQTPPVPMNPHGTSMSPAPKPGGGESQPK